MADPGGRIFRAPAALAALMRTRRRYAELFSRNGAVRAGPNNPLTNGPHGPLSARSVYKIRYVLQQALIKRFRTWKAILADRHIENRPFRRRFNNRPRVELEARRELAAARMAAPPVSHHKQPTGAATFNAQFEQAAGPGRPPNAAPEGNTAVGRATLMGRGAEDAMEGGRRGFPGRAGLVQRLLGENARWWHTSGLPAGVAVGAPNARPNRNGALYVRRITNAELAAAPYDETAGQLDYMTQAHIANIADFKRRQNLQRFAATTGDQHGVPYNLGNALTQNFDLKQLLRLPGGAL